MVQDNMTTRLTQHRALVTQLGTALRSFQESNAKFRILKTVTGPGKLPQDPSLPSKERSPKTLFILDSSFNPPQRAHLSLAQSAMESTSHQQHEAPYRFLLLFSTMNADKAPSAASFDQRLALMSIFAGDMLNTLRQSSSDQQLPEVDVGVTTAPYYTDKSAAIEQDGSEWYPSKPTHVHLLGFDTITRFFAPKYYPRFNPPLSALNPYFEAGHELRVTLRPDDDYGNEAEQRAFVKRLEDGEMEADGGKREWARQVELVPPRTNISSTKVRNAAKQDDWETVEAFTTPGVAQWVKGEDLYGDDDRGAKMA